MLIPLLLAGCASTPTEVMEQGERTDYTSKRPPREAAECIERNASEIKWGLLGVSKDARMRVGKDPNTFEVLYQEMGVTIAVALASPAAGGSAISVWRSPGVVGALRGEGTLEQQMVKSCE